MVIALFGDSCTGKSMMAEKLSKAISAQVFSGKDYLKLAKSESMAAALFKKKLRGDEPIIYVISEKEQLALLPEGCIRVLVTASLATIQSRFAARMHGNLPAPVAAMLERKYGQFESEKHDLRVDTDVVSTEDAANEAWTLYSMRTSRRKDGSGKKSIESHKENCNEITGYPAKAFPNRAGA